MSIRATLDWLRGDAETPWLGRILERDPAYGEVYRVAGRLFASLGRHTAATSLLRKAIEINPQLWGAHADLGRHLFCTGEEAEARRRLEDAFKHDPFDVEAFNVLQLMDLENEFVTLEGHHFRLRLGKADAGRLKSKIDEEIGAALTAYESQFGLVLQTPWLFKLYPTHDDFSVFATGFPELDAAGFTCGRVIAVDTSAADPSEVDRWVGTVWRQLGVAFVRTVTRERAPDWFVTGIVEASLPSAKRAPWTKQDLLAAAQEGLLTANTLDRRLSRPSSPSRRVALESLAGYLCDFVRGEWGAAKLDAMLTSFADGHETSRVLAEHLGIDAPEFDRRVVMSLSQR